jgi:hypothetical protein
VSPENSATDCDGSFLRTSPVTSVLAQKPSCENYATWALRLRLAYSLRKKSALRMNGNAGFAWPTARAEDSESAGMRHGRGVADTLTAVISQWQTPRTVSGGYTRDRGCKDSQRLTLEGQGALWKTPDVPNGGRSMPEGMTLTGRKMDGTKGQVGLENQAKMWTTPSATDANRGGIGITDGMSGSSLTQKVNQWPSPRVQSANGVSGNQQGGEDLQTTADKWPTPRSRDQKGGGPTVTRKDGKSRMDQLDYRAEQGFSPPARETPVHGDLSLAQARIAHHLLRAAMPQPPRSISRPYSPPSRRKPSNPSSAAYQASRSYQRWSAKRLHWWTKARLNPAFVTWLMGWPTGHALCACSATEWSQFRQHMRGALSRLPTASGPWIWEPPVVETQPAFQMEMF